MILGLKRYLQVLWAELRPKHGGLYSYSSYEEYRQTQIEGNLRKIDHVWATEEDIHMLAQYIRNIVPHPRFGICHGTRRGLEQKWFRESLGIDVIGTEISPSAAEFPHTIQWDFHDVKDEWIDSVDFIYSNSFDHSYKPKECLDAWMSCVKPSGVCILEWTAGHSEPTKLDPFGAGLKEYRHLINSKYELKDTLRGRPRKGAPRAVFLIVQHRK